MNKCQVVNNRKVRVTLHQKWAAQLPAFGVILNLFSQCAIGFVSCQFQEFY